MAARRAAGGVTAVSGRLADGERLRAIRVLLALALVAGLVLSVPLWLTGRPFPLLPRLAFVPSIPEPFDRVAFALLILLSLAIAIRARPSRETIALALLTALLVLADHTRCQPWVYQYVLMLLVAAPLGRDGADVTASRLDALRVMVAAIYAWSGVQKVNVNFLTDTGPWLVEPIARHLPAADPVVRAASWAIPSIELFVGVGLLAPRLRRAALLLGVLMHVFVLHVLGPFGHDENTVVWPWNLAMIGLLVLLFGGTREEIDFGRMWACRPALLRRVAVAAVALMPAFNLVGLWDGATSWSLYAGMATEATVYVEESALPCLPEDIRRRVIVVDGANAISVYDWAIEVLNVPPYPERWFYRRLRDRLCRCDPNGDLITFVIFDPARWRRTELEQRGCGGSW